MGILGTSSWRDDDSGSVKILRSDEVMVTMVSSTHRCHPERLRGWMWTGWSLEMEGYRRLERRSRGEADQLCLSQSSRDETSWRTFPQMARRWSYSIGHAQHCRATAVCSFAVCTLPIAYPGIWNRDTAHQTRTTGFPSTSPRLDSSWTFTGSQEDRRQARAEPLTRTSRLARTNRLAPLESAGRRRGQGMIASDYDGSSLASSGCR